MREWLFVAAAGAFGTSLRYGLGLWLSRFPGWPWATLLVNVLGSFAIVMASNLLEGVRFGDVAVRPVVITGALGGFTTYSAFNHEVLAYFDRGDWGRGCAYLGTTVLGCLIAGALALMLSRALR